MWKRYTGGRELTMPSETCVTCSVAMLHKIRLKPAKFPRHNVYGERRCHVLHIKVAHYSLKSLNLDTACN